MATDTFDPLSVVESQSLLRSEAGPPVEVSEPERAALDDQLRAAEPLAGGPERVAVTPVTDAPAIVIERFNASFNDEGTHGFVTGIGASGTDASFVVINDASAPNAYDFTIGDGSHQLALESDGSVSVYNSAGEWVNTLSAPWAKDANGRVLATHYTVEGDVVTQHVEFQGAAFPVTADPTTECGLGWCSVYWNRSETRVISDGGSAATAIVTAGCAVVGGAPGAALCATIVGSIAGTAAVAYGQGDCVGEVGF